MQGPPRSKPPFVPITEVLNRASWKIGDVLPGTRMRCESIKAVPVGGDFFKIICQFAFRDGEFSETREEEEVVSVQTESDGKRVAWRESFVNKGGCKPAPTTPRPNVTPGGRRVVSLSDYYKTTCDTSELWRLTACQHPSPARGSTKMTVPDEFLRGIQDAKSHYEVIGSGATSITMPKMPPLRQVVVGEVVQFDPNVKEYYTLHPRTDWLRIGLWLTAMLLSLVALRMTLGW